MTAASSSAATRTAAAAAAALRDVLHTEIARLSGRVHEWRSWLDWLGWAGVNPGPGAVLAWL